MFFLQNKEYRFVLLVLRSSGRYVYPNNFNFEMPFEIATLEVMKLVCTDESLVPRVGSVDKNIKGTVFLDQNQAEWYITDPGSSRPDKTTVASVSAWNNRNTRHAAEDVVGHVFITEQSVLIRHLTEILIERNNPQLELITAMANDIIKMVNSS